MTRARMHHKVVGNFGSEVDVRSLHYSRFRSNETSDVGAYTRSRPAKKILTEFRPRYFESEPDFRSMHTKLERLLWKSLTTLEVMTYYLVVHTGPGQEKDLRQKLDSNPGLPLSRRTPLALGQRGVTRRLPQSNKAWARMHHKVVRHYFQSCQ